MKTARAHLCLDGQTEIMAECQIAQACFVDELHMEFQNASRDVYVVLCLAVPDWEKIKLHFTKFTIRKEIMKRPLMLFSSNTLLKVM